MPPRASLRITSYSPELAIDRDHGRHPRSECEEEVEFRNGSCYHAPAGKAGCARVGAIVESVADQDGPRGVGHRYRRLLRLCGRSAQRCCGRSRAWRRRRSPARFAGCPEWSWRAAPAWPRADLDADRRRRRSRNRSPPRRSRSSSIPAPAASSSSARMRKSGDPRAVHAFAITAGPVLLRRCPQNRRQRRAAANLDALAHSDLFAIFARGHFHDIAGTSLRQRIVDGRRRAPTASDAMRCHSDPGAVISRKRNRHCKAASSSSPGEESEEVNVTRPPPRPAGRLARSQKRGLPPALPRRCPCRRRVGRRDQLRAPPPRILAILRHDPQDLRRGHLVAQAVAAQQQRAVGLERNADRLDEVADRPACAPPSRRRDRPRCGADGAWRRPRKCPALSSRSPTGEWSCVIFSIRPPRIL